MIWVVAMAVSAAAGAWLGRILGKPLRICPHVLAARLAALGPVVASLPWLATASEDPARRPGLLLAALGVAVAAAVAAWAFSHGSRIRVILGTLAGSLVMAALLKATVIASYV